ncbi:hypothetical protein B0I35DRAFT_473322 [Stachybotrys elegans]|uniref:Uncharacterized protein n=1 Tax=Stachybotrys elegans TaxID=80388 RepID=A0A8K0T180_9HYPO|nr:hypothetical protein B0I35DRAFT_473322 [Stachybotrys elegans]
MATADEQQPAFRAESPSPDHAPTPALGLYTDRSRCVSTASSMSRASSSAPSRESLSSDFSRQSSASYQSRRSDVSNLSRQSMGHDGRTRRRGYMRPQGTDFAASARSRESVMSLGSIAHLQYYFARTGLLDGKGGQLARKKQPKANLDMSVLDGTIRGIPRVITTDGDTSFASMGSSPESGDLQFGSMVESPVGEYEEGDEFFDDGYAESESGMLPPTVSTYHHKEKVVPKPPTIQELRAELQHALELAKQALGEVRERKQGTYSKPPNSPNYPNMPEENSQGWYELQGMNILDLTTLAIRAAKMYYTAHDLPDVLDSIKPEKQVRADLLGVMEVLKQMATRNFRGGMKDEEIKTMDDWIASVFEILHKEDEIESAERAERKSWTWLAGDWSGRERERERAFLMSMDTEAEPLPEWAPAAEAASLPTPFLEAMQNGLRLVKLHNAIVKRSRRRFGGIPTYHTDTQKPYRCADNLRYWAKAAELRFEVMLSVDGLGLAYNTGPQVWIDFEAAILKWSRHVREEITGELNN